ncbi:MAG: LysR family transcriptional regulator substrate-binding protein, partial [Solirubrobacteraceae bacterium]
PHDWSGQVRQLGWEEFVVVLPDGDPLLHRASIALDQLADRRWVHFAPAHGLAEIVDLCCARAGFNPHVAVRTSQVAAAPRFAATGIGPALVPEHIVPAALVHLARPAAPRLIRAVCAYTRGEWTPLTRAFLETLRDFPWGPKPRRAVDLA